MHKDKCWKYILMSRSVAQYQKTKTAGQVTHPSYNHLEWTDGILDILQYTECHFLCAVQFSWIGATVRHGIPLLTHSYRVLLPRFSCLIPSYPVTNSRFCRNQPWFLKKVIQPKTYTQVNLRMLHYIKEKLFLYSDNSLPFIVVRCVLPYFRRHIIRGSHIGTSICLWTVPNKQKRCK